MEELFVLPRRLKAAVLGGILLLAAVGTTLAVALAYVRPEGLRYRTLFVVFTCICDVWLLAAAVIYLANVFRKFQIRADREGIYVYCTLVPFGLIPWSAVASIGHAAPQGVLDAILEPDLNALMIALRSPEEFKAGLNLFQRIHLRLHGGKIKASLALCKGKGAEIAKLIGSLREKYAAER